MRDSKGRFIKGNIPWSASKKGVRLNTGRTHFKKGDKVGALTLQNWRKEGGHSWNKGLKTGPNLEHSKRMKGRIPWNYRGVSPRNKLERDKFRKELRIIVLKKADYKCEWCSKSGYLHIDHIEEWAKNPELRFELTNLRVLCRECHYFVTFGKQMPIGSKWGMRRQYAS